MKSARHVKPAHHVLQLTSNDYDSLKGETGGVSSDIRFPDLHIRPATSQRPTRHDHLKTVIVLPLLFNFYLNGPKP